LTKVEKDKDAPPKAVIKEMNDWITNASRAEHAEARRQSQTQHRSIVAIILALSATSPSSLSEAQHAKALEYLSLSLGIRDRQEIVRVMCQRNPDHLTAAIREGVDAYTPMIRDVHQAVNLSDTVWDFERFLTDMLKIATPSTSTKKSDNSKTPTVEDFADLLHRHQNSSHKFLHQVCKNSKPLVETWKQYVLDATAQFNTSKTPPASASAVPEKAIQNNGIERELQSSFNALPGKDKTAVLGELEEYSKYLDALHTASASRISDIIKRTRSAPFGPGAYLARWQGLMDATAVTPATMEGKVRYGGSKSVREEGRKDVNGEVEKSAVKAEEVVEESMPKMPGMQRTVELFGERFAEILGGGG
jgi:hypothetical protein